ncbi:DUF3102 domain-containing protein [Desulfosporosinus lacus]|uniref:DUF3102 domain-containing protein n=1 Tax=Desulfosporosinus lacus TaxID=329936 RepID=UPI0031F38D47
MSRNKAAKCCLERRWDRTGFDGTKELVPHGEWLKWLTESVSYSPRRGREAKWCIDAPFDFNSMYTVFDAKGCFFMHILLFINSETPTS